YGIVIDAGSSHSEVFLYQWAGNKDDGTGDVHERDYCTYDEGIAEGVSPDGIVSCVNNVLKSYPQDSTSLPLLYLGATAGMRLLNITNTKDASLILMALRYALQTTKVQVKSVDIIQGEDEGLFSWITTNFLSQTLNQSKVEQTFGALDLGGSSTQYAFAADLETVTNASSVKNLTLYGYKYSVISKSFLCFGLNQALHRNHALIFTAEKNTTVSDPCSPKNYTETVGAKFYLENPCVQNKKFSKWLQFNLDQNLTVLGESNYEKCKHNVKGLINEQSCKDDGFSQCLEMINLAEMNMKFMAFSSFYYVVSYLNGSSSLEKFINATKDWCSLSLDQITAEARDEKELSHLLTYCFGAIYIAELCTSNYGFNYSTWNNLFFKQRNFQPSAQDSATPNRQRSPSFNKTSNDDCLNDSNSSSPSGLTPRETGIVEKLLYEDR
ncbi:ectonucleoside triphosphate diphosphohydrolase 1-like, partial [Stegodyphus dumicola]|uniref:ectonucleoside triphosphate diphosphohydrolase 1-like n=1 Tax=Stegodyphus dumicola TaxID=202533 RepID=UPI0015AC56D2